MMRGTAFATAVAMGAAILLVAPTAAQEPGSRQTREFVQAAAQSDAFEILEGETVLTGSRDPRVQAFAKQMIKDHQQTSRALVDAAARAGLAPPAMALSGDQAGFLGALQSLKGDNLDRTYARQQVLAHRSAIVVEQMYSASGDDPNLRQAAASAVPTIQAHAAMAQEMATMLGAS
jgi:putative membrane protein